MGDKVKQAREGGRRAGRKGCPWDADPEEAAGRVKRGFGERTFAAVATADARS